MMRNIHFFNLAPGAEESRVIELLDGALADFAMARGCMERRTLKIHDSKQHSESGNDTPEAAQYMNESLWPDLATAESCWSQGATGDFATAKAELEPMRVMVSSIRYITP